jgi:hypothetical protein
MPALGPPKRAAAAESSKAPASAATLAEQALALQRASCGIFEHPELQREPAFFCGRSAFFIASTRLAEERANARIFT